MVRHSPKKILDEMQKKWNFLSDSGVDLGEYAFSLRDEKRFQDFQLQEKMLLLKAKTEALKWQYEMVRQQVLVAAADDYDDIPILGRDNSE